MKARRCELSVPGSSMKMMSKAAGLEVDEVLLDLEDSVAPEGRPEARQNIIAAAHNLDWGNKTIAWRINPVSSPYFYQDLIEVAEAAGERLHAVIMPKVNRPEEIFTVATILSAIETSKGFEHQITIEAQIETAEGMLNVEKIAAASPERLEALIFGPGDFAASIGAPGLTIGGQVQGYPGHIWHYALSRILVAARANGLEVIDGPYAAFKDQTGLEESARLARLLGYDGKWAIHPSQIEPIQKIFTPEQEEVSRAERIVEAYEASLNQDQKGAATLDGEMIDAATVKMALRTLRRAGKDF
ncbi:MAG TPA: CoA ester lyase [Chloroflexia bacterium]|nr:CoA ester lyase [Chloroflexia bacterium]